MDKSWHYGQISLCPLIKASIPPLGCPGLLALEQGFLCLKLTQVYRVPSLKWVENNLHCTVHVQSLVLSYIQGQIYTQCIAKYFAHYMNEMDHWITACKLGNDNNYTRSVWRISWNLRHCTKPWEKGTEPSVSQIWDRRMI